MQRRFFASRPTKQTIPGQSVELAVTLRKDAPPVVDLPKAVEPEPTEVKATWLTLSGGFGYDSNGIISEFRHQPDGGEGYLLVNAFDDLDYRRFQGEPFLKNLSGGIMPVAGYDFPCVDMGIRDGLSMYYGAAIGSDMSGLSWALEWNYPWGRRPAAFYWPIDFDPEPADGSYVTSSFGARAWAKGSLITVMPWSSGGDGGDFGDILTAKLLSNGVEVSQLTLEINSKPY